MAQASELIRDALQEITVQAAEQPLDGDDTQTALRYLNRLIASWPVDLEYTEITSPNEEVTVPGYALRAIVLGLAVELAPQYDIPITPALSANATSAYLNMLSRAQEIEPASYTDNLPLGSGNRYPGSRFRHYYAEASDEDDDA